MNLTRHAIARSSPRGAGRRSSAICIKREDEPKSAPFGLPHWHKMSGIALSTCVVNLSRRTLGYESSFGATQGDRRASTAFDSESPVTPSYLEPRDDGHTGGHTSRPLPTTPRGGIATHEKLDLVGVLHNEPEIEDEFAVSFRPHYLVIVRHSCP